MRCMPSFGRDEVERVAALARLRLSEEEAEEIAQHLDAFLDHVTALERLDTSGVEPTYHVIPLSTPLRSDSVTECLDPEVALANAPERQGTAFVVPKVIASDEVG